MKQVKSMSTSNPRCRRCTSCYECTETARRCIISCIGVVLQVLRLNKLDLKLQETDGLEKMCMCLDLRVQVKALHEHLSMIAMADADQSFVYRP